jgi:hypothetical protein
VVIAVVVLALAKTGIGEEIAKFVTSTVGDIGSGGKAPKE